MATLPDPLDKMVVVPPGLEEASTALFELACLSGAEQGGITIGKGTDTRVLVYNGPCPKHHVERVARGLLLGRGYKVSTVRDPAQLKELGKARRTGQYHTATAANPTGD